MFADQFAASKSFRLHPVLFRNALASSNLSLAIAFLRRSETRAQCPRFNFSKQVKFKFGAQGCSLFEELTRALPVCMKKVALQLHTLTRPIPSLASAPLSWLFTTIARSVHIPIVFVQRSL
jgi:hypothetical protein